MKQRGGGDAVVGWMGCSGEVGDLHVAGDGGDVVEETHQGMQWRGVGNAAEVFVWLPISPPSSVLPHIPRALPGIPAHQEVGPPHEDPLWSDWAEGQRAPWQPHTAAGAYVLALPSPVVLRGEPGTEASITAATCVYSAIQVQQCVS